MSRFLKALVVLCGVVGLGAGTALAGSDDGLGRIATPEEIAAWDIDVRPDGQGLPEGRGTAAEGEVIYLERCAFCHGEFGEGAGRYPVLMSGEGSLTSGDPVKTIGSYWPFATTVFDYVNRAMPFGEAQSLTPDEVYAVTAFLLYLNDIVDEGFEIDQDNLAALELPNRAGFVRDPRPDTPRSDTPRSDTASGEPCMIDCKAKVEVVYTAKRLDVTPTGEEAQTE